MAAAAAAAAATGQRPPFSALLEAGGKRHILRRMELLATETDVSRARRAFDPTGQRLYSAAASGDHGTVQAICNDHLHEAVDGLWFARAVMVAALHDHMAIVSTMCWHATKIGAIYSDTIAASVEGVRYTKRMDRDGGH